MELTPLFLKKNEERRIRGGHLWVYSNEVDNERSAVSSFEKGQQVLIIASNGQLLGTGYVNPHTLICARLVSRDPREPLTSSLLANRLKTALALRDGIQRVQAANPNPSGDAAKAIRKARAQNKRMLAVELAMRLSEGVDRLEAAESDPTPPDAHTLISRALARRFLRTARRTSGTPSQM